MSVESILIYTFNMILGFMGALIVVRFGGLTGLVDYPNGRSSHLTPTPKGGGIGILVGFLGTAAYLCLSCWLWLPAAVLSMVSLLGDRYDIAPKLRLIIQFACALFFLIGFFYDQKADGLAYLFVFPLAIYIVGTANFYNFMDGINGIAGITGVVGFLLMGVSGTLAGGDAGYVVLSMAIAGACLGFLPNNIPNARVFMGDVGSVLLGFVYACMVVVFSRNLLDIVCLSGLLLPFYADELTTMVVRIKDDESLSKPHRRHLYQILANEFGVDHWKISACYGVVQLMIGIGVIFFRGDSIAVTIFMGLFFVLFSLVSLYFRYLIAGTWSKL